VIGLVELFRLCARYITPATEPAHKMGIPMYRDESAQLSKKSQTKLIRTINDRSRQTMLEDDLCEDSVDRMFSLNDFLRDNRVPSALNRHSRSLSSSNLAATASGVNTRVEEDTFQSLLSQIRSLGDAHDASLMLESSMIEDSENTYRVRNARIRANRTRVDALGQRLSLVRSARAELRRVESDAMQTLEHMSEGQL